MQGEIFRVPSDRVCYITPGDVEDRAEVQAGGVTGTDAAPW